MNLTYLSERISLKEVHLNQHLKLLKDSGLITKQNFGKKVFFAVTESGLAVLKIYRPLISESHDTQKNDSKTITISL
jgi:DNA-binding HxlR family transcriptional regulator